MSKVEDEGPILPHCEIAWIDNTGESTNDQNEPVGIVYREAYTFQGAFGGIKMERSRKYHICAEHAKMMDRPGMEHWRLLPLPTQKLRKDETPVIAAGYRERQALLHWHACVADQKSPAWYRENPGWRTLEVAVYNSSRDTIAWNGEVKSIADCNALVRAR